MTRKPEYLSVKNWHKFQHYRGQETPSWIKLHRSLLTDHPFCQLPDDERAHLMLIWLLAAMTGNRIPNDPVWVAASIHVDSVNLDKLLEHGWLIPYAPVDNRSRNILEFAYKAPVGGGKGGGKEEEKDKEKDKEKEGEGEGEGESLFEREEAGGDEKNTTLHHLAQEIQSAWNAMAELWGLPRFAMWTESRKRLLRARVKNRDWLRDWEKAIRLVPTDKFRLGENDRGWRATPDWFLKDGSVARLIEDQNRIVASLESEHDSRERRRRQREFLGAAE